MQQSSLSFPDASKGYVCPYCQSYVKIYKRRMNSNMAVALLALYKSKQKGFIKVEDYLLEHGYKRCGDFSYLRHYQLIEKMNGKREDGSSRNGFYRLTQKGVLFCRNKIKLQEKFVISNNKLHGFEGKEISIKDALGVKFNYEELIKG